jgi:ABC-type uncharacterized transport system involved in gliding motility auxiliary subunit
MTHMHMFGPTNVYINVQIILMLIIHQTSVYKNVQNIQLTMLTAQPTHAFQFVRQHITLMKIHANVYYSALVINYIDKTQLRAV